VVILNVIKHRHYLLIIPFLFNVFITIVLFLNTFEEYLKN
jgi:hypothetical protein